MKLKTLPLLLVLILTFTTTSGAFASNASPTQLSPQSELNDLQKSKDSNYIIQNDPIDEANANIPQQGLLDFQPFGDDPGTGATRVNLVTYGSYAELATQDTATGTFSTIQNNLMWIIGNFVSGTVGTIIYNVVDLLLDNIEVSKVATAKTMVGYTYPTKQGQVWYDNSWHTLFESTNRNTYKYYYALYWNKDKVQRQGIKDFTPDNGYGPARIQTAAHYNNNSYIQTQAYNNYLQGKKYTTEEWF
ncbi:hypothetical protein [Paenibacillus senegalimassiliensis]|uniref:hypothetical protein n=1 Tax=Paenibacillus senegalimassiliensis TaxID=1737426 RepID=UPI00073F7832|nr:hypothetical protein [Paenibacillus senegalimassiliensis]